MQQAIRDWLSERGMAQYADTFAAQNVDLTVLPDLTDQDLKDLGVLLGDRRKLLAWAAGLRGASSTDNGTDATPQAPSKSGERRQVTVLFSDIVDSTAMSRSIDPEDLRVLIRSYQDAVTKTVCKLDGLVAGFRGDGVLVYFGYPRAHEDEAERAVCAGLELIAAVRELPSTAPLNIRVGIATGLVVVGDLIRSGDTQERDILGETPNLAARLLSLAEPNTVVIADATRRLLGDLYDFTDLGLRSVKGIADPVRTWSVLQSLAVESRYEALHGAGITELTGRDDELNLLVKRWKKAQDGDGQVVLISGEPGIGKSRLTAALMEEIANEPHARLRYFCSPQHSDSAFFPVIGHLERGAGFAHGDDAETKLGKLEKLLTANSVDAEGKSLVAALLSLPTDRYPALDYDAAKRRAKTMETLHGQVETLCARSPVLMILEDAHWIDPTSHEAFGRTVEKLKALPVLLVITYRPEFTAPWIGDSHVTSITLNRLGNREASQIVASLAGNKPLSAETIADIVDRSDGIPLFLEEMTKAVLEAESEGAARETVAAAPVQAHAVPASLHASLMSRLDRLGAAKGIAQVGAAIGRSFSHTLLAAVTNEDPDTLRIYLDRLIASGLLFRQGQPPDATYLFKHALIRDAAYSMLLREPRRALHARILQALESKFADIAETQPEVLAHHAQESGQIERAIELWGGAGLRTLTDTAFQEAIAHLTRAQELLSGQPEGRERRKKQIQFQLPLTLAVMNFRGFSARETKATCERCLALIDQASAASEQPDDTWLLFAALQVMWGFHIVDYDQKSEREIARRCLALGQQSNDSLQNTTGHMIMGESLYFSGDFIEALAYLDTAVALYRPEEHRSTLKQRMLQDTRVQALTYRSWVLVKLGYPDAATADGEMLLADAQQIGHTPTTLFALHAAAVLQYTLEHEEALKTCDELLSLADSKSAAFWQAYARLVKGVALSVSGRALEAIEFLNSGLAAARAMGANIAVAHHLTGLAVSHAELGEFDDAWRYIEEAERFQNHTGERSYDPEVWIAAGKFSLMPGAFDPVRAEQYLNRALEAARKKSLKGSELMTVLPLARLWRDQGRTREAYDLLSPIYNWFTEGFEWTYMKQAKALLEELKSSID